jgi:hypothetical protein
LADALWFHEPVHAKTRSIPAGSPAPNAERRDPALVQIEPTAAAARPA